MKRIIACVLALVLVMSFAFAVNAEEVKIVMAEEEPISETVEATAAEQTEAVAETQTVGAAEEQEEVSAEIVIGQFAEEETASEEIEIEQFAEEETGFWAWLKGIWQAILRFFGL